LQIKNEQNCSKFNRNVFNKGLNSKSEQQIAEELLNDLSFEKKNSTNYLDNISPSAKKFLILFATITSAVFSWVITPSKGKTVSFLFSFITGSIVYLILQKINTKNTNGAQKKILEKISENTINSDLTEFICKLEKDYSLTSEEMRKEILNVYKRFLMFFLKNSFVDLNEVNRLISLKKSLGLSSQEIGECHYECSQQIFNTNLLFLERQASDESSDIVNKFVFLSDRILSLDSKKGYQYETSRIKRVLNFSSFDFDEIKNKLSEELFIKSIKSVQNGENKIFGDLEEVRQVLGINSERSEIIKGGIFKDQLKTLISKEIGFGQSNVEKLKDLQSILSLSNEEFTLCVTQESSPLILEKIEIAMKDLIKPLSSEEIEKISKDIFENRERFLVSTLTISSLYLDATRNLMTNTIKTILTSIKTKAISSAVEKIETLLLLTKNLETLYDLLKSNETSESKKEINEIFKDAAQNFSSTENQIIYKTLVENLLKEPVLSKKKEETLKNLQLILNIDETGTVEIYKTVVGPIFQQAVKTTVEEGVFTDEKRDSLTNLVTSLKIEENYAMVLKTSLYRQKLQEVITSKSILSPQDLENFDQLRFFLNLSFVNVQNIHDTICEPVFKKSIQEAMGASGIVPSNYWDGLEKLRKRLRITESRSRDIFYIVMKDRLKTLFEKAVADDKRKKQPKEDTSKDAGEDPTVAKGSGTALGIEASNPEGNELLNLVEIYFRNRVFSDQETPAKEQKKIQSRVYPEESKHK